MNVLSDLVVSSQALECLSCLKDCEAKRSLEMMVDYVLKRIS